MIHDFDFNIIVTCIKKQALLYLSLRYLRSVWHWAAVWPKPEFLNIYWARIHQRIEIEGEKWIFGDVNILPSISLVFTNVNLDSIFDKLIWGICVCVAENRCSRTFLMKRWVDLNFHRYIWWVGGGYQGNYKILKTYPQCKFKEFHQSTNISLFKFSLCWFVLNFKLFILLLYGRYFFWGGGCRVQLQSSQSSAFDGRINPYKIKWGVQMEL
jgi:hypothetical protein